MRLSLAFWFTVTVLAGCSDSTPPNNMQGAGDDMAFAGGGNPDFGPGTPASDLAGVDFAGIDFSGVDLKQPPTGDMAGQPSKYLYPAVWIILMENHSTADVIGNAAAPFISMLASTYAQATAYTTTFKPSLPNYIEMSCGCEAGATHNYDSSDGTAAGLLSSQMHMYPEKSIGGLLEAAGVPWRAYGESMPMPCAIDNGPYDFTKDPLSSLYVTKHVPFLYFQDVFGTGMTPSATCMNRVVPFEASGSNPGFMADLNGGTYAYQWITPNMIDDIHDGSVAQGDAFVKSTVTAIQASAQYKAGGVIFLLFDEGTGSTPGPAFPFLAISTKAKMGYKSTTPYTHTSFLATVEDIFKLPRTGDTVGAPAMLDLFQ